ncbi:hypothetical protein XarjCFBP7653_02290 [Xanthomonas arboricola]|nr:hypothetical protein XarjCFBP7653_02290 [Xanthomonas arboricola]
MCAIGVQATGRTTAQLRLPAQPVCGIRMGHPGERSQRGFCVTHTFEHDAVPANRHPPHRSAQ